MAKITTKLQYKHGYEAAQNNKPSRSPHRAGTDSEKIWLAGYHAYMQGSAAPEEPRKRRTKVEMEEAKKNPPVASDFNTPSKPLPACLMITPKNPVVPLSSKPREAGLLEKLVEIKTSIKSETDPELLELLHMDLADLEWIICVEDGPKPSTIWDDYKRARNLNFELNAA